MSTLKRPPLPALLPLTEPTSLGRNGSQPVPKNVRATPSGTAVAKEQQRNKPFPIRSTRPGDELAIKYQQLQSLLREAHQDIAMLQDEVAVLRRTIAAGRSDSPPLLIDTDNDGPDVRDLQIELEKCRFELTSAIARCAACPMCSLISEDTDRSLPEPDDRQVSVSMELEDLPWLAESKEFTLHEAEEFFNGVVADYAEKRANKAPDGRSKPAAVLADTLTRGAWVPSPPSSLNTREEGTQRQSTATLMQKSVDLSPSAVSSSKLIAKKSDYSRQEELEEELVYVYRQLRKAKEELREVRE
ncbi:hypothetical protein HDU86_004117 [Geranomyces michiganensis]|nr:hypothetical protein HDU86_004117 [Geranomyces michiganensis]